ncbi:tetratricopeptide repeat protein [Undibacterium pigrum]|uniref:Tetratricopeptide repeat protein n=1 Tax=Undibacterium pigrum TaxID=401470 RepID=A0A318JX73_9BURK|nr:tetratricopeptide repeat protein [Undibacterium pigrum]PXX45315.1 tetratricopeptide repeat protein [Undibacterium pigrum]
MKKTSYLFAAMLLAALGSGFYPVTVNAVQAQEAAEPAKQTVRAEMGKPLNEIQELLNAKQFPQALEKINALDALDKKTPYEMFAIHRLRAVVASGTNDSALLASSFDNMINTEFLKEPEKLRLMEAMAGTWFNEKKYPLAREWASRYLAKDPANQGMNNLLARAYYLENDYANTIKVLNAQLAEDDKAKRTPTLENLKLLGGSYQQIKDKNGYATVLERLIELYPQKEYWADILYTIENRPGFSDRLRLDMYRLLLATNNLEEGPQFVEMTELALLAGLPAEAKTTVDAGYAANLLGTGKDASKHKQLRDKVNKQAADDIKTLDAGEASAKSAKTGVGLLNIGYNYVINGQHEKGLALMEQGLAKGGLKSVDEAKLHLGMAYLQAGNRDKAKEILKSIQSKDGAADLARLWLLVPPAGSKAAPAAK